MTMFTSGCPFKDMPDGLYKAWEIPIIVKTSPVVPSSVVAGRDSAEFVFQGVGIDFMADKMGGFGSVDIFLDGALVHTADLGTENLPRLRGVTVFRSGGLKNGAHRIRVVSKSGSAVEGEAFRVYGA